jgi:hypothetical protein
MGSTTKRRAGGPRVGALAVLVGLAAMAPAGPSAQAGRARELVWRGACYCKTGAELQCTADLTERECTKQCQESLCDDWFWLERRPCWNWGYGG